MFAAWWEEGRAKAVAVRALLLKSAETFLMKGLDTIELHMAFNPASQSPAICSSKFPAKALRGVSLGFLVVCKPNGNLEGKPIVLAKEIG